jgi:thiamine-monophosphate kinase
MDENRDYESRTEIGSLGEFGLIDRLTSQHQNIHHETLKGVGDDAAVLDCGDFVQVVTTDLLLEGIHFDLMYHPLRHLGYKAVAVNVSDVCAMNARPTHITMSLGISNRFSVESIEEFYEGVYAACKQYDVDLIGGDTTSSRQGMVISVTALGKTTANQVVYRSGASPGDLVCITGDLGAAYLGLQLLEREKQLYLDNPDIQPDLEDQDYVVGRQLKPEARVDMVELFRQTKFKPTAMIDISDGLASDIFHICKQSQCGVVIEEAMVPLRDETQLLALKFQLDPITTALSGGEDYELLFTASPDDLDTLKTMPGIYIIGEMKSTDFGKKLLSSGGQLHDLKAQGWVHF